jgi:hypothetical protein
MPHDLKTTQQFTESSQAVSPAEAKEAESTQIRKEFAEISPWLKMIAHETPPEMSREQWDVFTGRLRARLEAEAKEKSLLRRWRVFKDVMRFSDSRLWSTICGVSTWHLLPCLQLSSGSC